jgi:hypothetical protein
MMQLTNSTQSVQSIMGATDSFLDIHLSRLSVIFLRNFLDETQFEFDSHGQGS